MYMARVKPSGMISEIIGKIKGTIFQRSAAGLIARTNSTPVNKRSERLSVSRSIMFIAQQEWLKLTDAERDTWKAFTALVKFSQKNNVDLFINAQQLFIKIHIWRIFYDKGILINPAFFKGKIIPVSVSAFSNGVQLFLTTSRVLLPAQEFLVLFASVVVPNTINNPGNRLKLIKLITSNTDSFDITGLYINIFGKVPLPGEKIFLKSSMINLFSGLPSIFTTKPVIL